MAPLAARLPRHHIVPRTALLLFHNAHHALILTSWSASTALTCSWFSMVWTVPSLKMTLPQSHQQLPQHNVKWQCNADLLEALDQGVLVPDLAALVACVLLGPAASC